MEQPRISSLSSQFLIQGIEKSQPVLMGGWDDTEIPRFAKNLETTPEECAGALSCRRYQDQLS
jgi:hypothetical protein